MTADFRKPNQTTAHQLEQILRDSGDEHEEDSNDGEFD